MKARTGSVWVAVMMLAISLTLAAGQSAAQRRPLTRTDARTRLQFSAAEREHLRAGMRAFLESVQGIVDGLAANQMKLVARSAKMAGVAMLHDVPASTALALPPGFILMSMDTHQKFDELAQEAQDTGTKSGVLRKLSEVLTNCTACHAAYRF